MTDFTKESLPSPESFRPLVPVEVMGGTLYVRALSAGESTNLPEDTEQFLAELLLKSTVYADGSPVWTEESQALAYPRKALTPLLIAAWKANGLSENAVEDAKGN